MGRIFELIRDQKSWKPREITKKTLKTLNIAPSKEAATLSALRFLSIVDEYGRPTKLFDELREAFKSTLRRAVLNAYNDVFDQIPIDLISQDTLVKFFALSGYSEDTAEYQGVLFVYLCNQGGIDLPNASVTFRRARFSNK